MKRALVFLLLACSKETPKPTVDASVTLPKTTCEQGPWDEAARTKHHANAAKLGQHDPVMDKVVDQGTRALSKEERALYTSAAGNCSLQTRDALKELGHAGLTNLYARALERFSGAGPDEDRQTRWKQVDAIPNAQHAWDEQTQAMNRLSDLDDHVAKYAKAHVR